MQTTRQKIESRLCDLGLFESQATKILDYAIPLIDSEMKQQEINLITWDRPAVEYPDFLHALLFDIYLKKHVYQWAEENMPQAWWKPIFNAN